MRHIPYILLLLFHLSGFAQSEVTPAIEKQMKQAIEKEAQVLQKEMKSKDEAALLIEFAVDTFRIEKYMELYMEKDGSTLGMTSAMYNAAKQYDSLLNKYYKKLSAVLRADDKKILIHAQKAWVSFRDIENKLIGIVSKDEYSGGGTMQQITNAGAWLSLVRGRTTEIFEHLARATQTY